MGIFLGIDLGTSYFKAALFDGNGKLLGLGRQVVGKVTGRGDACELPVKVFWDTLHRCTGEAMQNAGITPGAITSVSYSSQANSFILLDSGDKPLTPLVLWPDRRAVDITAGIGSFYNDSEFLQVTGLGISPGVEFCLSKLLWFQEKRPGLWGRVRSILSISDYLTFSLTGTRYSDLSTASLTGLLDVTGHRWWDRPMGLFSLDPGFFAVPRITGSYAGLLTARGARLAGLEAGIPYYIGGLDHHCAAIGSGIPLSGHASESTGTVLSCVSYPGEYHPVPGQCTSPGLEAGHYFQMAFDDNGARALEWYRQNYAPRLTIPELLVMAGDAGKGSGGLVAKPCAHKYDGLGGFDNVGPSHGHGHFTRAILESTARSLASLVESVKGPCYTGGVVSTGGGARSSLWVKIKAGTLGRVFYIPGCSEAACLGAAMIGARGTGRFGSWGELTRKWVRFKEIVKPGLSSE